MINDAEPFAKTFKCIVCSLEFPMDKIFVNQTNTFGIYFYAAGFLGIFCPGYLGVPVESATSKTVIVFSKSFELIVIGWFTFS